MHNDITTRHPALAALEDQIRRSRDCYKGTDAIKRTSNMFSADISGVDKEYLPMLSGQDRQQYDSYKNRAVFYGAMSRTVTALVGAIDRKPPQIKNGEALEPFMNDVTGTGVSLAEFLKDVEEEVMISGRAVVCIDRKNSQDNRPYLVWYKSEDCTNWFSEDFTDFDKRLSGMVFRESYYKKDPENKFNQTQADQYREFELDSAGNTVVNLWRNVAGNEDSATQGRYEIVETYQMTRRGKQLGFIPCVPVVADGSPFDLPKPPLLDLVDVNIAHYRNSADYEHGMHWTALPTPVLTGLQGKDNKISIGSGSAIILPDPSSSAKFLEFSGTGLGVIKTAMDHKESMMSMLGGRMLSSRMDQSTSAEVARINYSGDTAALCNLSRSMSRGFTRLLRMVSYWDNLKGSDKVEVFLNEDFVDTKLAGKDITALMSAYQGGAMSLDSLLWNMSQGERLPSGRTVEEEASLIESDFNKEADMAMSFEEENVEFSGNNFKSAINSVEDTDDNEDK